MSLDTLKAAGWAGPGWGGGPVVARASGDWFYPIAQGGAATSAVHGNNLLRLLPWLCDSSFTLGGIQLEVTAAGDVGATMRPAIYSDTNGSPAALLLDAGPLPADAIGLPVAAVSLPMSAGLVYWLGALLQGVASVQPTMRVPAVMSWPFAVRNNTVPPGAGGVGCGYIAGGIAGALPAVMPAFTGSNFAPRPAFRVA
jgi:hypothetical protein